MNLENIQLRGTGENQAKILEDLTALPEGTIKGMNTWSQIYATREGKRTVINNVPPRYDHRSELTIALTPKMVPRYIRGQEFCFSYLSKDYSIRGFTNVEFGS